MAFIKTEKKANGTYLRIVESYREGTKTKHRTLHTLGKVEDYTLSQLEGLGRKFLELAGKTIDDLPKNTFSELGRYNYGYALAINKLWGLFKMNDVLKYVGNGTKTRFDWETCLKLMIVERMNEPCSKRQCSFNQSEYIGFLSNIELHQFYRTLDIISNREHLIKEHMRKQHSILSGEILDVVFYDVTTLYFDSHVEEEGNLRQKGYSKDGKARKTQVVLGLLVDKKRNPISYEVYPGNTYEGATMITALEKLQKQYKKSELVVVADSGMIDKTNRDFMVKNKINYIIGDPIKSLGKGISSKLIDPKNHTFLGEKESGLTYVEVEYKGRRLICTYSVKRAAKDAYERQKLIDKATAWLQNPSKYKQVKKRGAGRFIEMDGDGETLKLNLEQIRADEKFDGFKAISTTTKLSVEELLSKYRDLFEVEHAFRTLKSQLEIRPMFHWTDSRIKGHICMCFIAYAFLNYMRNRTNMQYSTLIKTLDKMQVSKIEDSQKSEITYMRANICEEQTKLLKTMNLPQLPSLSIESTINQYFR